MGNLERKEFVGGFTSYLETFALMLNIAPTISEWGYDGSLLFLVSELKDLAFEFEFLNLETDWSENDLEEEVTKFLKSKL